MSAVGVAAGSAAGAAASEPLSAGVLVLAIGGPVLAACVLLFALVVVCRRIDWHRWRHGHPVEPPRGAVTAKLEVVVASPRPVKIPVVCLQPDRCLDVAFPYKARHARTASGASTGGDDGLLTVMHAAPAGPLWSAAGVTRSEASGTPFDSPRSALWRPSGGPAVHDGLAAAAVFAAAQQQWQQQQQQQAAAPLQQPDAAAAPSAAAAPAAEGVAAAAAPPAAGGKHQRRRSFDLTWLARRAEKGAALVPDAAACSASPLCAEPSSSSSPVSVLPRAPLHGRSRSATLAAMV